MRFARCAAVSWLIMIGFLPQEAARADFKAGMDAYQRQDFVTAFKEFSNAAAHGDTLAAGAVGMLYYKGVARDPAASLHWETIAAAAGHAKFADQSLASAEDAYGILCAAGIGVDYDLDAAEHWFSLAISQGDMDASTNLEAIKAAQRDYQMRRMDALSMIGNGGTPWMFDVKQPIVVISIDEALGRI